MEKETKVEQWQLDVITRINAGRKKRHEETFELAKKEADAKMKELMKLYFHYYSVDEEQNKDAFEVLNKTWKDYANKVQRLKGKYITLPPSAFEDRVAANTSTPEFKAYLEKLKAEPIEETK